MSLLTLFDGDSFSPRRLFLASTIGAIYAYDDFSYLYQKSDGSTPVTALEQPVGLVVDQRYGGARGDNRWNNAAASFVGESSQVSSGVYRLYSSAGAYSLVSSTYTVTAGRHYEVTFTVDSVAVAGAGIQFESVIGTPIVASTVGAKRVIVLASATTAIGLKRASTAMDVQISGISVRELPGLHAYQSTDAARPVLSARYNLLLNTIFAGAVAGTPGTAPTSWAYGVSGGTLAVDASATDAVLTFSATAARHFISQSYTAATNTSYTLRASLSANSGLAISQIITVGSVPVGATLSYAINGVAALDSAVPIAGDTVAAVLAVAATGGAVTLRVGAGCSSNATGSVSISKPDLRLTADANSRIPAYQRVTTSTDYDSAGFPRFLRIDATDDFLQTTSVDPGTDKVFVCGGVTKMSDAAAGFLIESSTNSTTTAGTFAVRAPASAADTYGSYSSGSVTGISKLVSGYASPHTAVLCGISDISGDSCRIRVNGVEPAATTTDQGTGNYSAQPLYIGARAGTSSRLNNGRIYPMVICFKAVTAGEIAAVEAWVNARTRAY